MKHSRERSRDVVSGVRVALKEIGFNKGTQRSTLRKRRCLSGALKSAHERDAQSRL